MTTPNLPVGPDGAYVLGGNFGQDITEASAKNTMRGNKIRGFEEAQDGFAGQFSEVAARADSIRDAQLDMINRLDLLEEVEGYCSLFMSRNWGVPSGARRTLPFDTQLGPAKGAAPHNGDGILMKSKGLWRADAHVSLYPGSQGWWTSGIVAVSLFVSVINATSGAVFTERQYDIAITPQGSETASFSETFVIPSDNVYKVMCLMQHSAGRNAPVYGGTLRSALSVNKWDNGTTNHRDVPVAPNGGTLP